MAQIMHTELAYPTCLNLKIVYSELPYFGCGHQKLLFTWKCFIQNMILYRLISVYYVYLIIKQL